MFWEKKTAKGKPVSLWRYKNQILWLLRYQTASKLALTVGLWGLGLIARILLDTVDRPAITSGDLGYFLQTWQGWVLALLGFGSLMLYCIFDMQAMIIMSRVIINGERKRLRSIFREALHTTRLLMQPHGVMVILYATLMLPLLETALGFSFLRSLRIPDFIVSFIHSRFIFKLLYQGVFVLMAVIGLLYAFTFHVMILEECKIKPALRQARRFFLQNWKGLVKYYGLFLIKLSGLLLIVGALTVVIPMWTLSFFQLPQHRERLFLIWITLFALAVVGISLSLVVSFHSLKLTILYMHFTGSDSVTLPPSNKRLWWKLVGVGMVLLLATGGLAKVLSMDFDGFFPKDSMTEIIAHRAGGTMAAENTLEGLEAAIEQGSFASEIDVQRTKDGAYIVYHDDSLERLTGEHKRPGELTLAEIRELEVKNQFNPQAPSSRIATIEEMLDMAKGKINLYIELKGKSADRQMAEELYRLVVERNMLDQCAFISLNYKLIEYIEKTYPKATTLYLLFYAFGELEDLQCDGFGLEAETATESNIEKIHSIGKRVDVWTCNTPSSISQFLLSNADGIITDEVESAGRIKQYLSEQDDFSRILRFLLGAGA
ncbi:MAG: glycerophosphodiester phosphodiesterase family protein [Lachnospiraceae bacterium]|nr:glycerophosphodiester phosphodiesterase family protein [Lachnospiraceae bacterium]